MDGVLMMLGVFVFFLFMGMPVVFVLQLCCMTVLLANGSTALLPMLPIKMFEGMDNFVIMAIPLFILTGDVMNAGGVTKAIVNFCTMLIGRVRGSMAYVNILGSTFFAGITGSALSDISALGSLLIPAMEEEGYDREFSTAVTAASALQGPLIPPSLPAVSIAALTGVSTGALFLGTAVPGLMLAVMCCIVTFVRAKQRNYPKSTVHYTLKEVVMTFVKAFFPLMTPVVILGGMLGGIFTPTEAAAVAVVYCYVVSTICYEKIKFKAIVAMLVRTVTLAAGIYLIIASSKIFGYVLAMNGVPKLLTALLYGITENKLILLLIMDVFLIIWGMFLDSGPVIMILLPLLFPMAQEMGVQPIHFCALVCTTIMLGLITPPFGSGLFTAQAVGNTEMGGLIKELVPFIITFIVVILLLTIFPALTTTLPRLAGLIS